MLLNAIKQSALFADLPENIQVDLSGIAVTKSYKTGDDIFAQGDQADGFHLIAKGKVKVFKLAASGKEQILHIFGAGSPIGEAAVFMGRNYPAWAQALEDSCTVFFPRKALKDLVAKNPELAFGLLGILSQRLIRFTKRLENSGKEVHARLAGFLLNLKYDEHGASLGMSKAQLASVLDTTPETISRVFRRLKDLHIISEDKSKIKIISYEQLQNLADGEPL